MSTFPTTRRSRRGYRIEQVDEFLAMARRAYDNDDDASGLTAKQIRQTAFGFQRGGYVPATVDAALERLEDAFAQREREVARTRQGEEARVSEARQTAQVIVNRLNRPDKQRFRRVNVLARGYNCREVDRFSKRVMRHFRDGRPMNVSEVRMVVFRQQRRGYSEAQVDFLLDSVIDVMLAVS